MATELEFREAHQLSLTELTELRKIQNSTFDAIEKRKFIDAQNTILESSSRTQELQNELNCMDDPRIFRTPKSHEIGQTLREKGIRSFLENRKTD